MTGFASKSVPAIFREMFALSNKEKVKITSQWSIR